MHIQHNVGDLVLFQDQTCRVVAVEFNAMVAAPYYKLEWYYDLGDTEQPGIVHAAQVQELPAAPVRAVKTFNFSKALEQVKLGTKVARQGWNGKNMFIFLVPGSTFAVNRPPLLGIYSKGTVVKYHAHIDMRTADGTIVPWLASQADLLSDDWIIVK